LRLNDSVESRAPKSSEPNHPNRPFCAGNLRERAFREIWEGSPWFARLRSLGRADLAACRECDYRSACSRCAAQALVETGDMLGPLPTACERAAIVSEIRAARARERPAPGERQSSGENG
jgi:radical SAM protein with 4Fe4S-binding SPASM domain